MRDGLTDQNEEGSALWEMLGVLGSRSQWTNNGPLGDCPGLREDGQSPVCGPSGRGVLLPEVVEHMRLG